MKQGDILEITTCQQKEPVSTSVTTLGSDAPNELFHWSFLTWPSGKTANGQHLKRVDHYTRKNLEGAWMNMLNTCYIQNRETGLLQQHWNKVVSA